MSTMLLQETASHVTHEQLKCTEGPGKADGLAQLCCAHSWHRWRCARVLPWRPASQLRARGLQLPPKHWQRPWRVDLLVISAPPAASLACPPLPLWPSRTQSTWNPLAGSPGQQPRSSFEAMPITGHHTPRPCLHAPAAAGTESVQNVTSLTLRSGSRVNLCTE